MGVAVAVLKAVAALSVLGLAALVARLAAWRGVDPLRAAAFVALNPLVLVHVVGGAHNDGLTMLLAMLGVAAILSAREASGGAALVAAVAVKASTLFLAPFALLGSARQSPTGLSAGPEPTNRPVGRLLVGGALAAAAICVAAYLGFGWHWLHAFGLAGENQSRTSHLSIPITFARLTGLGARPGPRRGPGDLRRSRSPISSPGPGVAATGSAPPPGPPSASSSPPPGSSPGT